MRFLNGDLEVGEQVVTETMVNALFSFVFSSITWIVKKCGNAVRTKWKELKLQKKMKELFGEAADDVDITDDYEDADRGGDSGNGSGKATRVRMETREVLVVMAPEMVLLVVVPGLAEVAQIQEVRPVEVALAQEVMQAEVMQAEVVRLVVLVVEILV